jgi:hypothetical protein
MKTGRSSDPDISDSRSQRASSSQLPRRLGGGHEQQPPRLVHPCERRTTPLRRLIERDFKDASKSEKRKIVRENVTQLYGFDFD